MRKARRRRNTPCRKNKYNRKFGNLAASTKARWNAKLRIVNIVVKIYPITNIIVEDIKAVSKKNNKYWNTTFSPLQSGKNYFYSELKKFATLDLKRGFETAELRKLYNLEKTTNKLQSIFSAHNVDSWVLANTVTDWSGKIDNENIHRLIPLRFHRRQLHYFQANKKGLRNRYGGTISLGLKRGSLVKHPKYGLCYIGGNMKNVISLHQLNDGIRICKHAKKEDLKILRYNKWRYVYL
jgi:hypothetical protein